jgi:hypothetical protein
VEVFLRTTQKNFVPKPVLSMQVCLATIQDYKKKKIKNPELFPDF